MEVVHKLFKLKILSRSFTEVFISRFWNAGGSKRADSISATGTYHPPVFDTSSINTHLSHSKSSKQVWSIPQESTTHQGRMAQQGQVSTKLWDRENSLWKICTHQENGSANSCSTKPYGKHSSRVITRLWKEFLLEEGTAHGALDTRGCQLKKQRDELWQSLATSPTPLPPSYK